MGAWLRDRGVGDLVVCGLATDYCVQATVLDALRLGFTVEVVADGCRAVAMQAGDAQAAFAAMRTAGADVRAHAPA
jgi:nicotinamidase/pyrazinamidase